MFPLPIIKGSFQRGRGGEQREEEEEKGGLGGKGGEGEEERRVELNQSYTTPPPELIRPEHLPGPSLPPAYLAQLANTP